MLDVGCWRLEVGFWMFTLPRGVITPCSHAPNGSILAVRSLSTHRHSAQEVSNVPDATAQSQSVIHPASHPRRHLGGTADFRWSKYLSRPAPSTPDRGPRPDRSGAA